MHEFCRTLREITNPVFPVIRACRTDDLIDLGGLEYEHDTMAARSLFERDTRGRSTSAPTFNRPGRIISKVDRVHYIH